MPQRLGRQLPAAEHYEPHPVHIGGAQHPADVLRPARPVQRNRCECFPHRSLLPVYRARAMGRSRGTRLGVPTPSAAPLPPSVGEFRFSLSAPSRSSPPFGVASHRGDGMGEISGWDISSARWHAGPGEWSATSRLAPCSARLRAHALELEPRRCRRLPTNQTTGEVKTRIFPESRFVTCRWLSVAGPSRDQCCERRRERSLLSEPHPPCGCPRGSVRSECTCSVVILPLWARAHGTGRGAARLCPLMFPVLVQFPTT